MKKYYYDLHMHSCLSPCGDDDMTPNNIAGMGVVAKLDIMALTDHYTCRNCPAFFEAAKKHGIVPVPGMELTTAEDILASRDYAEEVARLSGLPIVMTSVRQDLYSAVEGKVPNAFPLGLQKNKYL